MTPKPRPQLITSKTITPKPKHLCAYKDATAHSQTTPDNKCDVADWATTCYTECIIHTHTHTHTYTHTYTHTHINTYTLTHTHTQTHTPHTHKHLTRVDLVKGVEVTV